MKYSRGDLSPEQKKAIARASDCQRVIRYLDDIISGISSNRDISVEEAKAKKQIVQQMYYHLKNVYVPYAIRK